MIWNDLELFNVEEIEETRMGTRFYRFPKDMLNKFGSGYFNKSVARMTTGCEIRFVGEAMITLGAIEADGCVEIFRGDFQYTKYILKKGEKCAIKLSYGLEMDGIPFECDMQYSKDVWRIVFGHDFCGIIYDVDKFSDIRPPKADEVPRKKILAYGSSITHSAGSNYCSLSYISRTGALINAQMLNKGMGGSCLCEKEVGDYLRNAQCDGFILELGVNMLSRFTPDEFYERASYIVKSALATGKKTVLISPFLYWWSFSGNEKQRETYQGYQQACKRIAEENESLIYVYGHDILCNITELMTDLTHPSMVGHCAMGERLSRKLNEIGFLE